MSLFESRWRILTLRPTIRETRDALIIKTALPLRLVTLFLSIRRVEIRPGPRTVILSRRIGILFLGSLTLGFDDIEYIDYTFGSLGTEWGWTSSVVGRHDQVESFAITAVTREGESRKLAKYIAGLLGVTIGEPVAAEVEMATCPGCRRPTSPFKPKCLYCGAEIHPAAGSDGDSGVAG